MKFVAAILIAVGVMIAALSGLCTVVVLVAAMAPHGDSALSAMALIIGAPPIAIGVGMIFGGLALWRRANRAAAQPNQ